MARCQRRFVAETGVHIELLNVVMSALDSTPRSDEERIQAVVLDYAAAWYRADASLMEQALHPELAKRAYLPGAKGKPRLSDMSALTLLQLTRRSTDEHDLAEVTILDRFEGAASVRLRMADWVDYMHLVRVGSEWKIINVLWELTPEQWIARGGTPAERTKPATA